MLKSKRYLYVGFMCNQVVEKILKAYYVMVEKIQPPYTHKLHRLAEDSKLYKTMSEKQKDFLDMVAPLNIEARYPERKKELFEVLDRKTCKNLVKETEEFVLWIKKLLKN